MPALQPAEVQIDMAAQVRNCIAAPRSALGRCGIAHRSYGEDYCAQAAAEAELAAASQVTLPEVSATSWKHDPLRFPSVSWAVHMVRFDRLVPCALWPNIRLLMCSYGHRV